MFDTQKIETLCTETKIEPIYAPANDHRAKGLAERLIQTLKRQLSCMKVHPNKKFNLEPSIHATMQRIKISKQKTTKFSPYEAHFARRCNTPISNITKKSKNSNYNKCYLDEDFIPGRSYLTDAYWADTVMCSDVEIEKVVCAANAPAKRDNRD